MSLPIKSRPFTRDLLSSAVLLILLVVAFAAYTWSVKQLDRAHKLRYRSYQLADILRQSGDDLTRMVRTYVATGDPVYRQQFQEVLDIRDGKKPWPKNYWRPYWDLVLPGARLPRGNNGQTIALLELMRQSGFTEEEFRKLATAKANSDALTIPEIEAMKLVETTGPAAAKNWAKAQRMLYDDKYHQAKAGMMQPIDEFFVLVDRRTLAAVRTAETQATVLKSAFSAMGLGLMFMLWRTYLALHDTLGGPIHAVHEQIARIGSGDLAATITLPAGRENSVLGWLATTQEKLIDAARKRQSAEADLRTAAAYARNLLEASLDPLVTISAEGVITDVNAASVHATGVPREQLIGTDFAEYFTEPAQARAGYELVFSEGFVRDYPLAIQHVSGRAMHVLYNATIYRDAQSQVLGVFATARDITERLQAEAAVCESEARFRAVVEGASMAVFVSLDMKFVYLNPAALHLLGAETPDQLVGQPVLSRIHPDYHTSIQQRATKVFQGERGVAPPQEEVYLRVDGSSVPVEATASPILYQGQSGAVVFVQDITERKQAEQALRSYSTYTRSLLEASLDPLVTINAEGKITDLNEASVQATGAPREQILGSDFSDYFTEPAKARASYQRVFSEGFVRDYPLALRHISGRVTDVLYNATVYRDAHGHALGVFATARDITTLKAVESEIRQLNAELEQRVAERTTQLDTANQELESFCYSVSHDLQSPLRAINGFSRALLEDYAERLDGKARDSLRRVVAGAQRMDQLIADLLMLSRITLEQMRRAPFDLSALVGVVANEVKLTMPGHTVEFVGVANLVVQGDVGLLRIALTNLLENAWKFTSKQVTARVEFGSTERGGETVYFVRDNGAGFDLAYAGKLFSPFQRMHKAREFPGTGIGLATVRRIVHRHGGRIWAEAQIGKGATFYFTLPSRFTEKPTDPPAEERHHENENQNHVLLPIALRNGDPVENRISFQRRTESQPRDAAVVN